MPTPRITTDHFDLSVYIQGDKQAPGVALVLPGLLDTKDYPHMRSHVDYLARHGYFALSFDPPGTWQSGEDINHYTITSYLAAVDELITYLGNKPTLVLGHSLGGFVATLAAERNSHIAALAAIMSPYSFVRLVQEEEHAAGIPVAEWRTMGIRPANRDVPGRADQTQHFDLPFSFAEDSRKYNSLENLGHLSIPKLFIAGEHDALIWPEMVRTAYDAAAEPKQYHLLRGADHNYRKHPELVAKVNIQIGQWLASFQQIAGH